MTYTSYGPSSNVSNSTVNVEAPFLADVYGIVSLIIAAFGFVSTAISMTLCARSRTSMRKYTFPIVLLFEEWLYSLANICNSCFVLYSLYNDEWYTTYNRKRTFVDCMNIVYPALFHYQQLTPLSLFCISADRFVAVVFPISYRNRWKAWYAWYISGALCLLSTFDMLLQYSLNYSKAKETLPDCNTLFFRSEVKTLMVLGLCTVSITATCISLAVVLKHKGSVVPIVAASSSQTTTMSQRQLSGKEKGLVTWLLLVVSFNVGYLLIPSVLCLLSFRGFIELRPRFMAFLFLFYSTKSATIGLSMCLKLRELRQQLSHVCTYSLCSSR